ncbi:MAG: PAS domain S-box protein [Chloroflexi bacterium]|nr:PAS domain S-box protein [Chloroflexota bacterium]
MVRRGGEPLPSTIFRVAVSRVWAIVLAAIAVIIAGESVLTWRTNQDIAALHDRQAAVEWACRALQGAVPAQISHTNAFGLTGDAGVLVDMRAERDRATHNLALLRGVVVSADGAVLVDTIGARLEQINNGVEQQVALAQSGRRDAIRDGIRALSVDLVAMLALIDRLVAAEEAAAQAHLAVAQQQRLVGLLAGGALLVAVALTSARRLRQGQTQLDEALTQLDTARAAAETSAARAERLLIDARAAQARYGALFEGIDDAIVVAGADGRFVDANAAATRLLGYSREDLLQRAVGDLHQDGPGEGRERFAVLQRDGRWRGEVTLRRRDGSLVPTESWQVRIALPDSLFYVAVWRDISERRELEAQQRDFLAMVTHELKSPLTTIGVYAQFMRRRATYSEQGVAAIITQVQRLNRLIDDLTDVARLDAGRLDLRLAPHDLTSIVLAAVDQARVLAPSHAVTVSAPPEPAIVACDRDRIVQVLLNLLSNAAKYAPAGTSIMVALEVIGGGARVTVRDQGAGIAAEDLPRLFDRFYRSPTAYGQGTPGLGLGLPISKGLVEAHGGTIVVESTPGAGSAFIVTLPRQPPTSA